MRPHHRLWKTRHLANALNTTTVGRATSTRTWESIVLVTGTSSTQQRHCGNTVTLRRALYITHLVIGVRTKEVLHQIDVSRARRGKLYNMVVAPLVVDVLASTQQSWGTPKIDTWKRFILTAATTHCPDFARGAFIPDSNSMLDFGVLQPKWAKWYLWDDSIHDSFSYYHWLCVHLDAM